MNKSSWVIMVVVFLVGIFIGYAIERQRAIGNMETAKLSYQNQIDAIKMSVEKLTAENKQLQIMLTPTPTPSEEAKEVKVTPKVTPKITPSPAAKSE